LLVERPAKDYNSLQQNFSFGHFLQSDRPDPPTPPPPPPWSTEGLSGSPRHVPSKTVLQVAQLQLVVAAAPQEAEQRGFARLPAGLRHVSFVPEVPELLEGPVVLQEGLQHPVVVGGEQAGQTVGLGGAVQQGPLGVQHRGARRSRAVVGLREVEDVGFVVEHQPGTAVVIPVHVVDTETWRENTHKIFTFSCVPLRECRGRRSSSTHLGSG